MFDRLKARGSGDHVHRLVLVGWEKDQKTGELGCMCISRHATGYVRMLV
jgi:hypothetical protein